LFIVKKKQKKHVHAAADQPQGDKTAFWR